MQAQATAPLDRTVNDFMNRTAKTNVAVIVPLFGLSADEKQNPVDAEVLEVVLRRVYSNIHQLYIIFVMNPDTVPYGVANLLVGRTRAGNVKNIPVESGATYADYVREGLHYALEETNAAYIINLNPWVMIQEGAIDVMVDRTNWADFAKIISGYDLRKHLQPEQFDTYKPLVPEEEYDANLNFLGMPRFAAEMLEIDSTFYTHQFLQRDMWQRIAKQGFVAIASQRVPIFPFDYPWKMYETKENFESDAQHFIDKWGFGAGLQQEDS